MKKLPLILLLALPCLAALTENDFSSGSSTLWGTLGNWSLGHVPVAGDSAVIKGAVKCSVDVASATAGALTYIGTARLAIGHNHTFTLAGTYMTIAPGSGGSWFPDTDAIIVVPNTTPATIIFSNSAGTFSGNGHYFFQGNDSVSLVHG